MNGDLYSLAPMEFQVCRNVVSQVLQLLYETVFQYGINHNDTRPNNFLWKGERNNPKVLLADWGISYNVIGNKDEVFYKNIVKFQEMYSDNIENRQEYLEWKVCFLSTLLESKYRDIYYNVEAMENGWMLSQAVSRAENILERYKNFLSKG